MARVPRDDLRRLEREDRVAHVVVPVRAVQGVRRHIKDLTGARDPLIRDRLTHPARAVEVVVAGWASSTANTAPAEAAILLVALTLSSVTVRRQRHGAA